MKYIIIRNTKIIITLLIIALFIWFIMVQPLITFCTNEEKMTQAAKKYFQDHQDKLPKDNDVSRITLDELYKGKYLKESFYIPYTKDNCNQNESWVKVRKKGNEYKYYTYLKCGELNSLVDNKGPKITLAGPSEITINIGDKYKEQGVESVVDNRDGQIPPQKVKISGKVNTSKVGNYEITYSIEDSLKNKTEVVRKVKVVSKLKNAVLKNANNRGYYVGSNAQNYIMIAGMLFRIMSIDNNNVKIVASEDIANVNYNGIEDWLDYYISEFPEKSKNLLVKNEYCNMSLTNSNLDTTQCISFTKKRYAYLASVVDINRTTDNTGTYLKPATMSWLANEKNNQEAYVTRNIFYGQTTPTPAISANKLNNYGVRPVITIKGSSLIKSGVGTIEDPYVLEDHVEPKEFDKLNTRVIGEYLDYSNILWRISEIMPDGTIKIITDENISDTTDFLKISYDESINKKVYNPTQKGNIAYYINNDVTKYIDTTYLVEKTITVPIYKDNILYGKEIETVRYKALLSAPNMYEIFSAHTMRNTMSSYWVLNSSTKEYHKGVVNEVGVVPTGEISDFDKHGIRLVAYLNAKTYITSGKGSINDPYQISM